MPHGYAQYADDHFADYLKLKSLVVTAKLPKVAWTSGSVVDEAVRMTTACAGLVEFGRAAPMSVASGPGGTSRPLVASRSR